MKKYLPYIVLGIIVLLVLFIRPIEKEKISGQNMAPTYKDGQIIWVNNLSYWFGQPQRGDVVIYTENTNGGHFGRVNRVIAVPGDTIRIQNGIVYLNDQQLNESYAQGKTEILDPNVIAEGKDYKLGNNEYFVLGDNRAESKADSRSIGFVNYHITNISNIHTFIEGKIL